jgi:hypothetical protein
LLFKRIFQDFFPRLIMKTAAAATIMMTMAASKAIVREELEPVAVEELEVTTILVVPCEGELDVNMADVKVLSWE